MPPVTDRGRAHGGPVASPPYPKPLHSPASQAHGLPPGAFRQAALSSVEGVLPPRSQAMIHAENENRLHHRTRVTVSRDPGTTDPGRNGRRAAELLSWHAGRAPRGHHEDSAYRR